jgi:hypothetical protein
MEKLEPGADYQLSFYLGTSTKFPPHPLDSRSAFYRVSVDITGVLNGQRSFDTGAANQFSQWDLKTMRVHATSPSGTITLSASGSEGPVGDLGGDYLGIDNVSLQKLCFIFDFGCWL